MIEKMEEYYGDFVEDIVRDDMTVREFILPQIMKENYNMGEWIYSPETKITGDLVGVRRKLRIKVQDTRMIVLRRTFQKRRKR